MFETENELHGREIVCPVRIWSNDLHIRSNYNLRCDFKNMHGLDKQAQRSYRLLSIDVLFHDTVLKHANRLQYVQCPWVTSVYSVE